MDKIVKEVFHVAGGRRFEGLNKDNIDIDCPNAVEIEAEPDVSDSIETLNRTVLGDGIVVVLFRDKETKKEYILAQCGDSVALTPRLG